jgi:lysophospholipid acyltransferase (LPLAT)-like uncharacterized protein
VKRGLRQVSKAGWPSRIAVQVTAALLVLCLRIARSTWRIEPAGIWGVGALLADGQPTIVAFWHGHMLPLLALLQGHPAIVISSFGFRGNVIGQMAQAFGHRSLQIEGAQGTRQLCTVLQRREAPVALAVDGPVGPRHHAKAGAVFLSALMQARILPVVASARPACVLRRWDRLIMPLPFATVLVRVGRPLRFANPDLQDMDRATAILSGSLMALCDAL